MFPGPVLVEENQPEETEGGSDPVLVLVAVKLMCVCRPLVVNRLINDEKLNLKPIS